MEMCSCTFGIIRSLSLPLEGSALNWVEALAALAACPLGASLWPPCCGEDRSAAGPDPLSTEPTLRWSSDFSDVLVVMYFIQFNSVFYSIQTLGEVRLAELHDTWSTIARTSPIPKVLHSTLVCPFMRTH